MRIFVAGGTGAIGRRLVPLLVLSGHDVVATTRSESKKDAIRAWGAEPAVLDALDRRAVREAVLAARPEVVVHELTAIPPLTSFRKVDALFSLTNRLRTEATASLIDAARESGARRIVAQSYAGWPNAKDGGPVKTEEDPLDPHPPAAMAKTHAAIRSLEANVSSLAGGSDLEGAALRYGSFYGPGTSLAPGTDMVRAIEHRQFPIAGGGTGVWSFLHIDDAAEATRLAIESHATGIFNVVDDDPAPVSEWLPELARVLGAKPPRRLPRWLGRIFLGEAGLSVMTEVTGSSNAKAKRTFGWRPAFPSWREGFSAVFAARALDPSDAIHYAASP
jgi:nucleoside-diphosphate-sugar epimerase